MITTAALETATGWSTKLGGFCPGDRRVADGVKSESILATAGPDGGWNLQLFTDCVRAKIGGENFPRIQTLRFGAELGYANESWSAMYSCAAPTF